MNILTQLMQHFGYTAAFTYIVPAVVLCSIARLGLNKGKVNIIPDIITHVLLLIGLGAGLVFQGTLMNLTGNAYRIWLYIYVSSFIISAVLSIVHLILYRKLSKLC